MVKRKRLTALGAAGIVLLAALAGCGGHKSADAAKASALATGSAAAAAKANLAVVSAKCGTTTAAGQIAAVKDMGTKAGRAVLFGRCGVPAAERPVVETQALAAFEKAHVVSGGHPARVTFFEVTLPKIIEANES
jgi:hypothetical protein